MLKIVLSVIFVIVELVMTVLILMQEGKSAGLTGITSGMSDTYWGKNKGRSMEGRIEQWTKILAILFFILAAVLSLKVLN